MGRSTDHRPSSGGSTDRASGQGRPRPSRAGNGGRPTQEKGQADTAVGSEAGSPVSQRHNTASSHEKAEQWVCFLGSSRVTEGEDPVPAQSGTMPAQQLLLLALGSQSGCQPQLWAKPQPGHQRQGGCQDGPPQGGTGSKWHLVMDKPRPFSLTLTLWVRGSQASSPL